MVSPRFLSSPVKVVFLLSITIDRSRLTIYRPSQGKWTVYNWVITSVSRHSIPEKNRGKDVASFHSASLKLIEQVPEGRS